MNKDIELGWLTGIIDGEGCLGIRIRTGKTKHHGIRPRFQPQLSITNTEKEMVNRLEKILQKLDIKYRIVIRYRKSKVSTKPQYEIYMYATALRKLLPQIREISSKHAQIDILLRALELTAKNKNRGHIGAWGAAPISNETLKEFDNLRMQLVDLHGRQAKSLIKLKAKDLISKKEEKKARETLRISREKAIEKNPKYNKNDINRIVI